MGGGTSTCACGIILPNGSNDLSHAADGAFADNTNPSLFNDTESSLTSKDVLLVVTHGLCVVNGAASTMIKVGVEGNVKAVSNA